MATGLIEIIKRASLDALNNQQMADLRYGTVISVNPLKVQITNQFTLPNSLLVVPKHLTDYEVDITIDDEDKKITIKNALKIGDKVALLRKQGGQSYFILDKI